MLIPIKIKNKKYKIKPISDLTTKEFIELSKLGNDIGVIEYIAWQTGETLEGAFFAVTSKGLEKAIGEAPDVTKLPVAKWVDKSKLIDTVGQRHQVESSNLSGFELLVFCLAVSQARSNNMDDVEKLQSEYLTQPFQEILPSGFFFFKKLRHGNSKGENFFQRLLYLIKTKNLKKRLGLRN